MTPFARYLVERRWQLLFATQGVFTGVILYKRFTQDPPPPLAKTFPTPPRSSSSDPSV